MTGDIEVSPADLARLVAPLGDMKSHDRLTGGMFATAFQVRLHGGELVVLKASTTDTTRLCRYERGLAHTEAQAFRELAAHGLPVPTVLLTDFSHEVVDADVVVTSHLTGTPWSETGLTDGEAREARRGLGRLMARMHRITAPLFGYPSALARMQAPDWRSAFTLMVEGILQDAADAGAPIPADRVRDVLAAYGSALDACTTASVVHGDLWAGNLFLDSAQRIVGLIDTERSLWGDPLFDLIGADQFGLWVVDPDLLQGNTEHGGILVAELASPTGPTRFALYRLYFSVILVTEISVREYEGEWVAEHRKSVEGMLAAVLQRFDELAPTNTTRSMRASDVKEPAHRCQARSAVHDADPLPR